MSEPYARILLHKQEGAADLIADTVREDSDRYPRPTPLDVFKDPPFDMSQERLFSCLEQMPPRGISGHSPTFDFHCRVFSLFLKVPGARLCSNARGMDGCGAIREPLAGGD